MSKNDELCIQNETVCIQNEELCIKNEEFCIKYDGFCSTLPNASASLAACATNLTRKIMGDDSMEIMDTFEAFLQRKAPGKPVNMNE